MFKRNLYGSLFLSVLIGFTGATYAKSNEVISAITPHEVQKSALTKDGALSKALAYGVYQVIYNPKDQFLYVASAEMTPGVRGGVIYRLDPNTLEINGLIHTDEKNFGMALDKTGEVLFVTNSLSSSVARINLKEKGGITRTYFKEKSSDGTQMGARTVIYDEAKNRIYVGAVGLPSVVWVLDAETMELVDTIKDAGKWVTGLLLDSDHHRLYVGNADGEILVINTQTNQIENRWKPEKNKTPLWLNFALDKKRNLLYVTEGQELKTVLALDAVTGKIVKTIPTGEALDIVYGAERDELYITHRDQSKVSVLNAENHELIAEFSLATHPNSLSLGGNDQLYVTVKEPFTPTYHAGGIEKVIQINLKEIDR